MNLDILKTLQIEHRCLLGQAARIEEQLDRIRHGCDTDYVLLNDRVEFLKQHYIEVHCPKDKALLEKLVGSSGNLGAVMAPFLKVHDAAFLRNLTELAAGLKAVLSEQVLPRQHLLRYGDAAMYHLREQVATEETGPFPWARKHLRKRDWRDVTADKRAGPRRRPGAACANVGNLFPGLEKQALPATTSMGAAGDPEQATWVAHRHRGGGH